MTRKTLSDAPRDESQVPAGPSIFGVIITLVVGLGGVLRGHDPPCGLGWIRGRDGGTGRRIAKRRVMTPRDAVLKNPKK
eukprot:CAMPEP_0197120692 /NCGR_PEP_ID=MMETSP1390-20130617/3082_1 /TAXON_ID=38833 /ORGANISM="Micromonas sp., Strain CCMP2099" /LENGTH=78 /DNA_ID=CAMNT_0042562535 /DNA_START=194 /DNA_END=427 /DNA_ORIENTATION=-